MQAVGAPAIRFSSRSPPEACGGGVGTARGCVGLSRTRILAPLCFSARHLSYSPLAKPTTPVERKPHGRLRYHRPPVSGDRRCLTAPRARVVFAPPPARRPHRPLGARPRLRARDGQSPPQAVGGGPRGRRRPLGVDDRPGSTARTRT